MRTIGLLKNNIPLQSTPGLTLITGSPGTGKTHLALDMAIADFETGLPVVYISMNHEDSDHYMQCYLSREKLRVLTPSQIDDTALLGDPISALSFAGKNSRPEHVPECSETIIQPGMVTFINLGWGAITDNSLRDYFVGRILQHLSLYGRPISLFVDSFDNFEQKINHPIIQYWLTCPSHPATFIMQHWLKSKGSHTDVLQNIPLFIAFRQYLKSAQISGQLLSKNFEAINLVVMNTREAFVRYGSDVSFIRLIESPYQVP